MQLTTSDTFAVDFLSATFAAIEENKAHSISRVRFLDSWKNNPLPAYDFAWSAADQKKYDDVESIDDICVKLSSLPTMQAMRENYPEMDFMPIFAWDAEPEEESISGRYYPSYGYVDFNVNTGFFWDRVPRGCGTIPHELRHAEQDTDSCLTFPPSTPLAMESLMINHDRRPLELLKIRRPASTVAYCRSVMKDRESHWDGRAANEALKAYLHKDNQDLLDVYDATLCDRFLAAKESDYVLAPRDRNYDKIRNKAFAEFIAPMRRMPFIDKHGHMEERPFYWEGLNLSPAKLSKRLSAGVNYKLLQAHMRDLSVG